MPGSVHTLADPATNFRAIGCSRPLGGLLALVLAAALSLSPAGPALADFETAVAAYEQGAYQEAQKEFEALAAAGDERAAAYLESIRQDRATQPQESFTSAIGDTITSMFNEVDRPSMPQDDAAETQPEESFTSAIGDTITSMFSEVDRPSLPSDTTSATGDTSRGTSGGSSRVAQGGSSVDEQSWNPFESSDEEATTTLAPASAVVVPERYSLWSTLFHLPGDATVIGLQYAAQFIGAQTLVRELQLMSRHRDEIALSILAGLWWLAIVRGLVGIAVAISRFTKAAATLREPHHYG